ncbi:conserved hypothetical protein [Ricinus communis]|uniref:Uncharacterized protein n=1 Tax=Ricinus communis TaxID=3988 RepID=B9S6K8_RICCO|nr:conserved hypothetical protein [Ricinus communis]
MKLTSGGESLPSSDADEFQRISRMLGQANEIGLEELISYQICPLSYNFVGKGYRHVN